MDAWLERLLDREQSARLATSADNHPHVVPVVFVRTLGKIFVPIDGKRKSGRKLKRIANIESNAQVCLLLDHYSDDWDELWWVRIDGVAQVCALQDELRELFLQKYRQYLQVGTGKYCIEIEPIKISRWASHQRLSDQLFND